MTFGIANALLKTPDMITQDIEDQWASAVVAGSYSQSVTASSVKVKLGPGDTGPAAQRGMIKIGTLGTAGSPAVAVLVQKNTLLGGRKGRGRMFLPGTAEADCDPSGVLAAANRTQIQTAWNSFLDKMDVEGLPLVLLHSDQTPPSVLESFTVSSTVATQRRRVRR